MARSEARLHFSVWVGLESVSADARLMYVVLLSDRSVNHAGVGSIRPDQWRRHSGLSEEAVDKALVELEQEPHVVLDRHTGEFLIRTMIRNDGYADQPYLLKGALGEALTTESTQLKRVLAEELRKLPPRKEDGVSKTGRKVVYPDPHACADQLDGGAVAHGAGPLVGGRQKGFREGVETGSEASADPPDATPSEKGVETHGGGGGGGGEVQSVGDSASSAESKKVEKNDRDDIRELCDRLADRVEGNGAKRPRITEGWRDAARLLLDRDGRDHATALRLIDWVQSDDFWTSNCLSMPTFRDKYDQLLLKAKNTARWRLATPAGTDSGLSDAEVNAILQRGRRDYPPPPAELDDDPEGRSAWYATKRDERRAADRADAERLLRTDAQAQSILARFRKTS